LAKKPYHISPERSHSGYSVIAHRIDDETFDPELLRQEISEILVELVRLARKRGRPRLKEAA
jgi:hypothetical protein